MTDRQTDNMRLDIWLVVLATRLTVLAQQTQDYQYWWLGLQSPFGGRNYNLEEVLGYWDTLTRVISYYNNCLEMHNAFLLLTTYLPGVYILAYNIQLFKI